MFQTRPQKYSSYAAWHVYRGKEMLAEIKINTAVIILTMQTMLLTFAYYNITTGLLQHGYRKKSNRLKSNLVALFFLILSGHYFSKFIFEEQFD